MITAMGATTLDTRKTGRALLVLLAATAVVCAGSVQSTPAHAAASDGYPEWSISGTSGAFSGEMQFPAGFPSVTFQSDSLASGTMIASGASTWIPESTSFGTEFGSSRDRQYISLRPAGNREGAPSTTTYTFETPSPVGTWGFSLGDIDAETLRVSATDEAGEPVPGEQLNVEAFNYCGQAGGPSCDQNQAFSVPTVSIADTVVSLEELGCPAEQDLCDTAGASAWFSPSVPLKTLTIEAEWKSGFPSYQTWFATTAQSISGSVVAECGWEGSASVQLLDSSGAVVATAVVDDQGGYLFPNVSGGSGYSVRVDPSALPEGATSTAVPVEVSRSDVEGVDIAVTSSFSLVGTVQGEVAVADVPVTLTSSDASLPALRTTTSDSGRYAFEGVTRGEYIIAVEAGEGVRVSPQQQNVVVDCAVPEIAPFELTAEDAPGPDDPDDPTDPDPSTPGEDPIDSSPPGDEGEAHPGAPENGSLAATGAPDFLGAPLVAGAAAIVLGALVLQLVRARRRLERE